MPQTDGTLVPRRSTLDGFAAAVAHSEGVGFAEMDPLTTLLVRTENTLYRITVLRPPRTDILVQGGRFFPETTEARLWGSSFGGSLLKMAWIGVGMRMAIHAHGELIITSPVRVIRVLMDSALPGPF